jgi:nuclease S1
MLAHCPQTISLKLQMLNALLSGIDCYPWQILFGGLRVLRIVAFLVFFSFISCCAAFSGQEHRAAVRLAEQHLSPKARAQIGKLLPLAPRADLAELATWLDEIRDEPAESVPPEFERSGTWHYANFAPGNCSKPICKNGQCVIEQSKTWLKVLSDKKAEPKQRALALAAITHLYVDLHQPLHLGFASDRGGNDFQLQLPGHKHHGEPSTEKSGTNLHAVWDSLAIVDTPAAERAWLATPAKKDARVRTTDIDAIAREGCAIVQAKDFYPSRHTLTKADVDAIRAVASDRLRLAGMRLARVLNNALD